MQTQDRISCLEKNGLLLDDAFNVIVSEAMSDEHADDILNGIATVAESSRASAWFTNDVSSAEVVKQQNAEMRKLTSMLTDLKSINKSKNASSRTLNYISDREERAESMKQKRDSAFHENGYNQNLQEKHVLFDMILVYSSMQSTWNNLRIPLSL